MNQLSATALHQLFLSGEVSARSIVETFIERIRLHDPQIGAFLLVLEQKALAKADHLDIRRKRGEKLGKLAAVPIAIKDNIHIKDEITTCASKMLSNYRAPFNASVIDFLEKEDAIFIGKANMDEFAMGSSGKHSAFFPTKNPWNLDCSPGGSSSGAAASVAANFCPLSLGSDTGGSIRQPAAMCGISGFKPSYGRVSRFGLVAFGSSLDQIGPMGLTVQDLALTMEAISHPCEKDATCLQAKPLHYSSLIQQPIKGKKIGVPWDFLENLHAEPKKHFENALQVYKDLGIEFVAVDLNLLKYSIAIYYILATAEASTNLARFDGVRYGRRSAQATTLEEIYEKSREEGFGTEVKNRILLGTYVLSSGFQDAYYRKAQKVRTLIIEQFRAAFAKCQMIALPVTPTSAVPLSGIQNPMDEYLQDLYTIGPNLAGLPAISVPCGLDEQNKPLGLQLIGPYAEDGEVLRFAHQFQLASSFHKIHPPAFKGNA